MLEQALKKLRDEMAANATNRFVQYTGNGLISHLEKNPGDAEKVIDPSKTILKSLSELHKQAQKIPGASGSGLFPDEVSAIIFKYFAITGEPVMAPTTTVPTAPPPGPVTHGSDFNVSLDEFLP